MLLLEEFWRAPFKDKVIFLGKLGEFYQIKGGKYFKNKTAVRYKKKAFQIPKIPTTINKYGRSIYYIDYDSGKPVMFDKAKLKPIFSPTELDIFLFRHLVEKFVRTFGGGSRAQDYIMWLMAGTMGLCVGFVLRGLLKM